MPPREDLVLPGDPAHGDPESPAYARIPEGATRGIVVIHEIYGPQPEIERAVERLADRGYAAIAPNLFHDGKLRCLRATFGAMKTGEQVAPVRQALRAREWLKGRTGLDDSKIGIIGFCFGGGFALLAGKGWGAVSANYGISPRAEHLRGLGPTIACFGGRDISMRSSQKLLTRVLPTLGPEHEVHVFDGAGHSFLTDGNHPEAILSWPIMRISYDPAIAEAGWSKIFAFLDRHLA